MTEPTTNPKSNTMNIAINEAIEGVEKGEGGPFGAVIIKRQTGEVVARAHNMVI